MLRKLIWSAVFLGLLTGVALLAPRIIDGMVEEKIATQMDKILAQSLDYESMEAVYLDDTITFNDVVMYDHGKPATRYNLKAEKVALDVDYSNALMKNFEVQKISAENVVLNLSYTSQGQSNFHNLQENVRHYLSEKANLSESQKVRWNVYDIQLNNVTVVLNDAEIGDVGIFQLNEVIIPRLSSTYSKSSNQDALIAALGRVMLSELLNGTLQGEYSKLKLMAFAKREFQHETGKVTDTLKSKAVDKAKQMALQFMQNRQGN